MYKISIEKFEGPLDLLLEIIEKKKLPLLEISLFQISEQFIEYLEKESGINPEDIIQFLVVGSRLALLKSRELIPSEEESIDEEGSIKELQQRLALYKPFRQAAKRLEEVNKKNLKLYSRESFKNLKEVFYFPKNLKARDLTTSISELLKTVTLPERSPQAKIKDIVSLEKCITDLNKIIEKDAKINFSDISERWQDDLKLVYFLGILELLKLRKIKVEQKSNFGTIIIAREV